MKRPLAILAVVTLVTMIASVLALRLVVDYHDYHSPSTRVRWSFHKIMSGKPTNLYIVSYHIQGW